MTDPSLMRGPGWVRCSICGELHEAPYPHLARDDDGSFWDVCAGRCAAEAGVGRLHDIKAFNKEMRWAIRRKRWINFLRKLEKFHLIKIKSIKEK